jgi:hypothetical protein
MRIVKPSVNTLVLGAGLTGSLIAHGLAAAGDSVAVLDKGRGPGGRLSLRRTDSGSFAHGCPLETVTGWARALPREQRQSLALTDPLDAADSRVQALPKHLLGSIAARFGAQVARIERSGTHWQLWDADAVLLAEARRLVLTAPAPQSAALLAALQPGWSERLRALTCIPNWSLLLAHEAGDSLLDASRLAAEGSRLVSQNALPSGESAGRALQRWVLQLNATQSLSLLEAAPAEVLETVLQPLGLAAAEFVYASAHRWRYAQVREPLPEPLLLCHDTNLAVCGDAFAGAAANAGDSADLQRCHASAAALLAAWAPSAAAMRAL